ncbi:MULTISPECIES: ABC transporter permease [Chelativorans]|jgi:peptide/nickel transport system permease protein|uniref:Binding-protein-dependent transport systems inner membrane component n=1 Tax=Chelativorans sp. (strain BNC1) TaxID=266779 RepID=Q11FQ7_CHESB|nr:MULTISPECIES: ABC transporter permease [Chelativorans]
MSDSSLTFTRQSDWRVWFAIPVLAVAGLFALLGEWIAPYSVTGYDYTAILSSPTAAHWFGTDELGRDILSRLIIASRTSVAVALGATLFAAITGSLIGLLVSYIGGRLEAAVSSAADIFIALPDIFFAILVMSLVAPNPTILTITIGIIYMPQFTKIVSAMVQSARHADYVTAARSMGASGTRIIFSDILPNILPIIVVKFTLTISSALLLEASLSFLGLGAPPPNTSWGQMVGSLKPYIYNNPWPIVFPSLMIFFVIMAVNVLGDWFQDYVNPEVRR